MSSQNLVEYLDSRICYYLSQGGQVIKDEHDIFVCRKDGVCLFEELGGSTTSQTLGALIAGMWQAAESVNALDEKLSVDDYVLQFSTSNRGIVVYPLQIENQVLLLAVLFDNELAPGRLKNSCRMLRDNLEYDYQDFNDLYGRKLIEEKHHENFLFSNISDREIDQLFSFAGN